MLHDIQIHDVTLRVAEQGAGPPLLLVHGFPLDHTMWRYQLEYFAQNYRVIAPDLRGFGASKYAASKLTMRQHADDLSELLAAMGVNEKVVLCGLSMGGYIAWQFVEHYTAHLAGLIVCDSLANADPTEVAQTRLTNAERLEREGNNSFLVEAMLPRLFGAELAGSNAEFVLATKQVMLSTSSQTCAAALRGMAEREDYRSKLSAIRVPTLILCGETDIIAPANTMQEIATAIPGAVYREIAGAGHMAPLEKPAEVNAAIAAFLSTCR
jgi:pimeloyl-ACP methyl ester carboxylesterase